MLLALTALPAMIQLTLPKRILVCPAFSHAIALTSSCIYRSVWYSDACVVIMHMSHMLPTSCVTLGESSAPVYQYQGFIPR